jgi:transcriptional regulator with AAA-type ATPase domain
MVAPVNSAGSAALDALGEFNTGKITVHEFSKASAPLLAAEANYRDRVLAYSWPGNVTEIAKLAAAATDSLLRDYKDAESSGSSQDVTQNIRMITKDKTELYGLSQTIRKELGLPH